MWKNTLIAGLLGGVGLMLWTLMINGILGFQSRIDMKQLPDERIVYETLKQHVVERGRYVCNPEMVEGEGFPENEPVFGVLYSGLGHEAAGRLMLVGLLVFFLAPTIGAWMCAQMSRQNRSRFWRKTLFFSGIGVIFALFGDLMDYGIGGVPLTNAVLWSINHVIAWTFVGMIVAWRLKPVSDSQS